MFVAILIFPVHVWNCRFGSPLFRSEYVTVKAWVKLLLLRTDQRRKLATVQDYSTKYLIPVNKTFFIYLCLLVQTNRSRVRPAPPWHRRTNTVLLFLLLWDSLIWKHTLASQSLNFHTHSHTQTDSQSRVTDLIKYK